MLRCSPFRYPRVLRLAQLAELLCEGRAMRLGQQLAVVLERVRAETTNAELPVFAPYKRALVEELVAAVRSTPRKTVELSEALRDVEEELVEQAPILRADRVPPLSSKDEGSKD